MARKSFVIPAIDDCVVIVDGDRKTTVKVAKVDQIGDDYYLTFYDWTAIAALKRSNGYWILCREDHKNSHLVEGEVDLKITKNKPKTVRW